MDEFYKWMRHVAITLDDHAKIINQNAKVMQKMQQEIEEIKRAAILAARNPKGEQMKTTPEYVK